MSPISKRRIQYFRSNKRGFWSLWIFIFLFFISLIAEIIANDKPLLVIFDNKLYFPIFETVSEIEFGGEFATEAYYKDKYVQELIDNKDGKIFWPLVKYSFDTINYNLPTAAQSYPTFENFFGTDDQGRDVFARLIYGFRISVLFGLLLTTLSSIVGIAAGAIQGYYGGNIDILGQRFIEIWSGLPVLFLLIILSSFVEPNFWWLLLIMLLFSWMGLVGVVRAEFLRGRNLEYVRAARALGLSNYRIMKKHILPNAMVATMTFMPFILSGSITTLTALDFLGFGLPPGSPSLGELLAQGKANLHAPWLGIAGFSIIAIQLSLLVFIGEGIRDAFDPLHG